MEQTNVIFVYVYPKDHPSPPKTRILDCAQDFAASYGFPFPKNPPLRHTQRGKPYFEGADSSFSITHSGDHWLCACGLLPLGVDLQQHRPCKQQAIARRFFHPAEQEFLRQGGDFFSIWSAKESFVKYTGEGISPRFSHFSVVNQKGEITQTGNASFQFLPFAPDYTLCLCTEGLAGAKIIYR